MRAEALTTLISLSPDNLLKFCQAQSEQRMRLLQSEDLNSGKKYIPSLYVERKPASQKLADLLDKHNRPVVILIGPPQVGKTNFVCHTVEERLADGKPCLFYPAVGMREGLLAEVATDFEWVLGDSQSSSGQIIKKLRSVLRRSGRKLVIFVDGWNEASLSLAQAIDRESELVCNDELQIVISVTSTALKRLLIGEAGNPSYIAQAAGLDQSAIQLLDINLDAAQQNRHRQLGQRVSAGDDYKLPARNWSVVTLSRYTEEEMRIAYEHYAKAYKVVIPISHKRMAEPYTLGIAMKLYQGCTLPDSLDEPALLDTHIKDKINRTVGMQRYDPKMFLRELADEMCNVSAPVPMRTAQERWWLPIVERPPTGLFEAALLTEVTVRQNEPGVDFYYGRERDFVIAYWVRGWLTKIKELKKQDVEFDSAWVRDFLTFIPEQWDMNAEFNLAAGSNAGLDALHWFFLQREHLRLIETDDGNLPVFDDPRVRKIFLAALAYTARWQRENTGWLRHAIDRARNDTDVFVRLEAVKLMPLLSAGANDLCAVLPETETSLKDFVAELLAFAQEVGEELDEVEEIILDALREMHVSEEPYDVDFLNESVVSLTLESLMVDESEVLRRKAIEAFGYVAPGHFLKSLANKIRKGELKPGTLLAAAYESGFENAAEGFREAFYPMMCPGLLEGYEDNPEALLEYYQNLEPALGPTAYLYRGTEGARLLEHILNDLETESSKCESNDLAPTGSRPSLDFLTLLLPFEDSDDEQEADPKKRSS